MIVFQKLNIHLFALYISYQTNIAANLLVSKMRKWNLVMIAVLFLVAGNLYAQDDIPDYKSKREGFLKILDKKLRADIATYSIGGISESLTALKLPEVPIYYSDDHSISFLKDTMLITITTTDFDSIGHKFQYYDDKYLIKIDNKGFWGSGTKKPEKKIESVTAILNKDTICIPAIAFVDLYEPALSYEEEGKLKSYCRVYQSLDKQNLYIYMLNGEGKNRYEVTWIIQNKQYLRRVVDLGY